MTELIIGGLFLCSLGMWAWREYQHDIERKDLLNRLMSRDFSEYTAISGGRPPPRTGNVIAAHARREMERSNNLVATQKKTV